MKKINLFLVLFLFCINAISSFAENYNSEILRFETHARIENGRITTTRFVEIKINNRAGDTYAYIVVPYSKGEKVDIRNAKIIDKNGAVVRELKSSEIRNQSNISDMSLYEDDFVKTAELKYNIYPYTVSYEVQTSTSQYLDLVTLSVENEKSPIREGKVTVTTSGNTPIKYKQSYMRGPEVEERGATRTYTWSYSYTPENYSETNADLSTAKIPKITVLPVEFNYGEDGSWESWNSFGAWIFQLNKGRDALPDSEKKTIDKLLRGVSDNKEKAKILYRYLQQTTRYVNVKIKIGGLQAYPASYVCANRYGDCKALSNYMQAMLKYAGIPSYYTVIHSSEHIREIDNDFPSQVFNHAILTVSFGADTVFLDNTDRNCPFGYVNTFIQNRKALLVSEKNSYLISVPAIDPNDVLCTRNIIVRDDTVDIQATQRGENFELFTFLNTAIKKNEVDKYIRNIILKTGTYDLRDYSLLSGDVDSAKIDLKARLEMKNVVKNYGKSIVVNSFKLPVLSYEPPTQRVFGVKIDMPAYYRDTIIYLLNDLPAITKLPPSTNLETPFGSYSLKFKREENKLIVYKKILIYAGKYDRAEYNEFYKFVNTIYANENKNFYLEAL